VVLSQVHLDLAVVTLRDGRIELGLLEHRASLGWCASPLGHHFTPQLASLLASTGQDAQHRPAGGASFCATCPVRSTTSTPA
jgi:hypothetical protein